VKERLAIVFHPRVLTDVDSIMTHYRRVADEKLANDFYDELMFFIRQTAKHPESFNTRHGTLRRVNLERFPYNFVFRLKDNCIRILVVRHHARKPNLGLRRK
jgi:plasmid stabilization system protein ParE